MITSNNYPRKVLKLVHPFKNTKYNPEHETKMDYIIPDYSAVNFDVLNH